MANWHVIGYAAQSKAAASKSAVLGADITGPRTQVAPVSSGTGRERPPVATRRANGEVAVGTVVDASTQELERPFVKSIEVGDAGVKGI